MSLIVIARHAQANFFGTNYDELSELGIHQATLLGEHWARQGIVWDHVYFGPKERHAATERVIARVYRAHQIRWPTAVILPDLDEARIGALIAQAAGKDVSGGESMYAEQVPESERAVYKKRQLRFVIETMKNYAAGQISAVGAEPWGEFKRRAETALTVLSKHGKGERVLAISSGGMIGMLVGCVLALNDETVIDMSSHIRTCSYTTIACTDNKRSLAGFNSAAHLPAALWTHG